MQKDKPKDVVVEDKKSGLLLIYEVAPKKEQAPKKLSKFQEKLNKEAEKYHKKFSCDDFDF